MITKTARTFFLLSIFAILSTAARLQAEDWYRWRGPDLNGISKETGWQTKWPDEGPKQLWKAEVGTGFSSVSVSRGRVYTLGNDGTATDTIYCFDAATGASIWKHPYPCELAPQFYEGGPSDTPTVDGDRVYSLSRKGDLFCLDAAKGNVIWSTNVHTDLSNAIPQWGFAGSPLVEGDLLLLDVGKAGLAFNKKTGAVAWHSEKSAGGYSTPVIFKQDGEPLVAVSAAQTIEVFKPADGKFVWSYPWKTLYDINAADAIVSGGKMFISSGCDHGAALLDISAGQPKLIWQNKNMRNHINTCVLWQGYLYGVDDVSSTVSALNCIAWDTGELKWSEPKFGKGSLIIADGKIIGLSAKGELIVAEPSPEGFKTISRAQVLGGKCWTTPVLSNGRIYCRNAKGDLACLDVSR
jgi:outer membrane protein assembly factor BamB